MGVSTNGNICYGILFEEDTEFPWGEREFESWWREVNGFESMYDEDGEYKAGHEPTPEERTAYWEYEDKFDAAHPLPFALVNAQSMSYPVYILALASTVLTARRGHPVEIGEHLRLTASVQGHHDLVAFCDKYDISYPALPTWYLSSFWET